MKRSELKALISLIDDDDVAIFDHVESKILSLGTEIIPILETEWEENLNPLMQERIENLIHRLQFSLLKERLIDWLENKQDDLLFGMWVIATYQYPDLELETLREQVENLFYEAWKKGQDIIDPAEHIQLLNDLLYTKYHFSTNTKNFHAPSNSMLNLVLEQKKGNPISIAVVYLLIAQRMRLPIYGVNLPKLFVLVYKSPDQTFYINSNNRGLVFNKDDINKFLEQLKLSPKEQYFEPCSHLAIVTRVLRNLEYSYVKLGDEDHKHDIRELLTILLGGMNSTPNLLDGE